MSVGTLPWSATRAALTAATLSASIARGASQLIVVRASRIYELGNRRHHVVVDQSA